MNPSSGLRRAGVNRIVVAAVFMLSQIVVLFCAGGINWLRGWIYAGVYCVLLAMVGVYLLRVNPEILNVRGERKSGTKTFDKVFSAIYTPMVYIMPAVAGLDFRFRWSFMSFWFVGVGVPLEVLGYALFVWAMVENSYFEVTVRIQEERGHQVCMSGPYQYARHPGYAGAILFNVGTPLILGSWWAFMPCAAVIGALITRTVLEDRTLHRELEGYSEYASRVKHRIIPEIW